MDVRHISIFFFFITLVDSKGHVESDQKLKRGEHAGEYVMRSELFRAAKGVWIIDPCLLNLKVRVQPPLHRQITRSGTRLPSFRSPLFFSFPSPSSHL